LTKYQISCIYLFIWSRIYPLSLNFLNLFFFNWSIAVHSPIGTLVTDTTDKETNERTDGRTDGRTKRRVASLRSSVRPSIRSSLRWSLTLSTRLPKVGTGKSPTLNVLLRNAYTRIYIAAELCVINAYMSHTFLNFEAEISIVYELNLTDWWLNFCYRLFTTIWYIVSKNVKVMFLFGIWENVKSVFSNTV